MAADFGRWIDRGGRLAQAADIAWSVLYPLVGNVILAGGLQFEFDHTHNHWYAGWNLHRDRERYIRGGDQNYDRAVYGGVGVVSDSED